MDNKTYNFFKNNFHIITTCLNENNYTIIKNLCNSNNLDYNDFDSLYRQYVEEEMQGIIEYCSNCAKNHNVHEYQDAMYGDYVRVKNYATKDSTKEKEVHRCTVCSSLNLGVDKKSKV